MYKIIILVIFFSSFSVANTKTLNERLFFEKYKNQSLIFDSKGAIEFEYICSKPFLLADCRSQRIKILRNINTESFSISRLLYLDSVGFYELTFLSGVYYIMAKRVINGLNITHYYTNEKFLKYNKNSKYKEIGKILVLREKIKLCGNYIKIFKCNKADYKVKRNMKIRINNPQEEKDFISVFSYSENRDFWINEHLLKSISTNE